VDAVKVTTSNPIASDRQSRFAAAYRVLEEAIAARLFPGCAFGVLAKDKIVLEGALGRFTYEDDAPAVLSQTIFDVASLTKVVATTAMTMLLFQRGQLNLEQSLSEFLPAFAERRPAADPALHITLRHLLAHSSGLPGYVEFFRTCGTPEALLKACMELSLQAEPGTHAEYSDPGFILLGKALEAATHERLDSWVDHEVLKPLGLANTQFCPPPAMQSLIPPSEESTPLRDDPVQGVVHDDNAFVLKGVSGHTGVFSNIPDLLRFAAAILGAKPKRETASLFARETVEYFARRQGPGESSRAIGWDTPSPVSTAGNLFSSHSIGHLGFTGCSLWIDLDARVAVAHLSNRTWPRRPSGPSQLFRDVRAAFHDAVREAL